ncbi:MAG: T9SS type A sorting domain-containing protein [Candidatus Glassbacteria bacterium]|nr:T9SS type A sorting domain-containing protein [Candidatus Glassbacteria bacterium]
MRNVRPMRALAASLLGLMIACPLAIAQDETTGYREMMKDVFDPVCLDCHNSALTGSARNGAPSSVNWDTYTLAAVNASNGNTRAQAGTMPPVSSGKSLSATQQATFQAWIDDSTALGTVVDYQDMRDLVFVPVCMICHSSTVSNRNGAPSTVNWDTYAAARTKAVSGNLRAQAGTMPPSGPLTAARKAAFQDWLWLDTPSGDSVDYATLSDSLFTPSCILCHDSNKSGSGRLGAPDGVDFDTYGGTLANRYILNNRVQTATSSPHGPQNQSIKDLVFNWIYAGTPGSDPVSGPVCDLDGSGTVATADVIWLILFIRDNAYDETYDYNGDGRLSISDAVKLVLAIRNGSCSDGGAMLAIAGGDNAPEWLGSLSAEEVEYVEGALGLLGLTPDEEAAFRLALHGRQGGPMLPQAFSLGQNSPNPFNPVTTISYTVPEGGGEQVRIEVFDISGRLIATLADQFKDAGSYAVFWDGTDSRGAQVPSGVYFYRLQAGDFVQTRKMVLLK